MAATKKSTKTFELGKWTIQWRDLLIAGSVALNLAVLVLGIAMMATNALDGMFIREGLQRFCNPNNDDKFTGSSDETRAVRDFTCAHGDAKPYFENGLKNYMNDYRIPHASLQNE